jgi:hypothetical protein
MIIGDCGRHRLLSEFVFLMNRLPILGRRERAALPREARKNLDVKTADQKRMLFDVLENFERPG